MAGKRDLDPGASPLHFFGAEVRRSREAAGMTLAGLGAAVPCDASTVSRVESGQLSPTERFAESCDETFPQMGGWFARFYRASLKWDGPYPRWFEDWVDAEGRAAVTPRVGAAAGAGPAPDAGIRPRIVPGLAY